MNQAQVQPKPSHGIFGEVKEHMSRHQKNMEMLFGFAAKEVVRDRQGNVIETKIVPARKPS